MKNKKERLLNNFKDIIEAEFKVNLFDKTRKRLNINARSAFVYNCRRYPHIYLTYEQIAEYLGMNHATAIHSFKNYEVYRGYDGLEKEHARVCIKCSNKQAGSVTDPIEWRDRYISRLIKLYRARPTFNDQIAIFISAVDKCKAKGILSTEGILREIEQLNK